MNRRADPTRSGAIAQDAPADHAELPRRSAPGVVPADRLDLKLLSRFLAVVEHGSFAKAARAVNLTQQAVAYSIASLEETLGVSLFERDQLGAMPTEHGRRLTHHARALLTEATRMTESLHALQSATAGSVRVGVSELLSAQIVPVALARLLGRHPDIDVTVREGTSSKIYDLLQKGEVDFMVGAPPVSIPLRDNVEQELLFEDFDHVAMRTGHPIARLSEPTLADLQAQTWIVPQSREEDYQFLCESFLVAGLEAPRHVIRSDGLAFGINLLLLTDYVSLTSLWLAPQIMNAKAGGLFRTYRVRGLDRKRRAFIRFMRSTTLSPAAQALIAEIRTAAGQLRRSDHDS